jgi:apolipoprotein N-acyltransferase
MLSGIMLNGIMLSGIMLSGIIMLSSSMLTVVMLNTIMLSVTMLSVVVLSAVKLSFLAPTKKSTTSVSALQPPEHLPADDQQRQQSQLVVLRRDRSERLRKRMTVRACLEK